jgi:hypothetical protein
MSKLAIKIIKKESQAAVNCVELKSIAGGSRIIGDQRSLADTVNDWIGERRKNRTAEGAFSDTQLIAWKTEPDTPKSQVE